MLKQTNTYYCDQCKLQIGELYGPLFVMLSSDTEPQLNSNREFCSFECLALWAGDRYREDGRGR